MSRVRLRLTLGLAIFEHVPGELKTPKVRRYLTSDLLRGYGIRTNTEIRSHDWVMATKHALDLRRGQPNTRGLVYKTMGNPTYERVNTVFGIG